ncbi:glycoside hydrolase [Streptomyces alkaliphilus]|uniref:Glycoside hydrolase n=1 Tax=Streptomyces alkaliphilus TaxID=1472722 RepID=A0A7W3Y3L4_9ACTN|nr:C40 family peptidase [Streptomyces alkaliphilus]MBB0246520.1 glycoside hydrolase [Streptomyces alkaliphilus]
MGAHRKPRAGLLDSPTARRGVVGLGAAALSATLLSQTAQADEPGGTGDPAADAATAIEEARERAEAAGERAAGVKEQVDELFREAGTATQRYNAAKERTEEQQRSADELVEAAAEAAERVNEARRDLGRYATAQYRHGRVSETATLLLMNDPQQWFDTTHVLGRAGDRQQLALDDYVERRGEAELKRAEAAGALEDLEERQRELQEQKEEVQGKLATARDLLAGLTEEEAEELAELERLETAEAERLAEEQRQREEAERREREEAERAARRTAEREAAEEAARAEAAQAAESGSGSSGSSASSGSGSSGSGSAGSTDAGASGTGSGSDTGVSTRAEQAIAHARAQLGKPYVWGATGPGSYDCSGLTQAAWRAAGVELPRVTWDQVNAGTRIGRADLRPGDLVFFYSDISHVGLYIGDGQMIHAPRPGTNVRVESISVMPFHSAVRPG